MEARAKVNRGVRNATQQASAAIAERAADLAERARAMSEAARHTAQSAYQVAQDRAVAGARATDETIRTHPYQAIGAAVGVGLLIGFLLRRR